MNNLTILENGLIPIYKNENGQAVNARELYEFLEIDTRFNDWIKDRIEKYDFVKDVDFISFTEKSEKPLGGRPTTEYILTLDTAKELAMVQNNEKGSEARKYFIAVEKKFKEITKPQCLEDVLIQSLQEMKALKQQVNEANHNALQASAGAEEAKQEVQAIRDIITINPGAEWRKKTNKILVLIGNKINDYKKPKDEAYEALKARGNCRPNILVNNLKARALLQGMSKSKVDDLNILDVLENEPRLKEIYITIVREMAIKYKVA